MRLAEDERARVPFALVGVVLLVASASAAAVLAGHDPAPDRTRGDRAIDRAETSVDAALAGTARTALRNAAENPVVSPADSRYGDALDPETAFRDALALRVYARFERALRTVDASAGSATASASLPRVQSTADAAAAIERTTVERVNDSVVEVRVAGVETAVERGGRTLDRRERTASVRVHSPTLTLHDRAQRFERLLDRGALDGPGLDRRLTDLLHRVVWLRGPLQYAGAPIGNVLANRHVALAANRALLDQQRAAFGRLDDAGSDAYARAFAETGLRDVLAAGKRTAKSRAGAVLEERGQSGTATDVGFAAVEAAAEQADRAVPISVNATADRAFVGFVDGAAGRGLGGTLADALVGFADRSVAVERVDRTTTSRGSIPDDWRLVRTDTTTERSVSATPAGRVDVAGRRAERTGRRVVTTEATTRRYRNGTNTRTVTETTRTTHRVTIGVGYEADPPVRDRLSTERDAVLDAPVRSVGPALRERYAAASVRRLLRSDGGADAIARRAVAGEVVEKRAVVRPAVPAPVRERAADAVASLRDDARNVTVELSTRALASGDGATADLVDRVWALREVGDEYDTATARAVAAAEEAYLARVVVALREQGVGGGVAAVGEELGDRGVQRPPAGRADAAEAGPVAAVEGTPPYLTLGEVTPATADVDDAYHPLTARNRNWFTAPHGAVAEAVVSAALPDPPDRVGLGRAGQALRAADSALDTGENDTLAEHRARLRDAVAGGVDDARVAYGGVLSSSPVDFDPEERKRAVEAALARWPTLAGAATAIANGSAAEAVAAAAAEVADAGPRARDRLDARLRANAADVASKGRVEVESGLVRETTRAAHAVVEAAAVEAVDATSSALAAEAARRAGVPDMGALPAGLPLAPVPGSWYATANAWTVELRGSWAEFTVRAEAGTPVAPEGVAYVRRDEPVAFDVNGDGRPDSVGSNERVSFAVEATVGVVVPPGPRGVGDTSGGQDERSPGW
ncbi:DUF7286 family protein [Halobacterium jilantaiense]|uniref:DUF7286 family protein n=1 Tax=Halobacterium jilantaiense TaxID=355548 RepID=UPI00115FECF8|nr:hypothetical protein [Halobacterium jilantaiense]